MYTPSIDLHYEDRAAPQLLGGVLYQLVWTANRWVHLADDQALVVEGDEDLVVATIKNGQVVALNHEQIKHLSGKITARAPAAYETLFAFLCSFHTLTLEKRRCTFVLTTNAALGAQQVDPAPAATDSAEPSRLCIDLLKTWRASASLLPERIAELTAGIKGLVASYAARTYPPRATDVKGPKPSIDSGRVRRAVAFLDEAPERWDTFLRSVVLHLDAGDSRSVFDELERSIALDPRTLDVNANALAYRLVFEVMQSGGEMDVRARHLYRASFDGLIEHERTNLLAWMRSAHPDRLWQLDRLNDLLHRVERLEGSGAIGLASQELRARHIAAMREQNTHFRVLGVDRDIPIERSWILDASWTGAEAERGNTFHAHRLLEGPHRVTILIAEGGGGKSTVLRRIAFDAATRDVLVLRTRAKTLAALADDTPTFAVALRRVIADQSGVTFVEATQLEGELSVLLLDGLDEIGERAEGLARECATYAATRGHLRVVISTRPSHAAAVGDAFVRVYLLPLQKYACWSSVVQLLGSLGEPEASAKESASRLEEIFKETNFDSLPLHVTMALHLARGGVHQHITMATLYDGVLSSLRKRTLSDRTSSDVDRVFAAHVLDATAWHLASRGGSLALDIVQAIADALGHGRRLAQQEEIDRALLFWEARAVLRRERVGGNDRLDFAHDSLRDFVAAQHLAQLPSADRRTWIAEQRHDAIVRFAVGLGGEALLDDVFAADPPKNADALIRCASAIREMERPPARFAIEVAAKAAPILASNISRTVLRVVDTILPLVVAAPEAFGAAADAAMSAGETWNVLAAWLIRVHSGVYLFDRNVLLELLTQGARRNIPRGDDAIAWTLWNKLLEPALDALVRTGRSVALDELIETLVLGDARLSADAHIRIVVRLAGWGYSDLLTAHKERSRKLMEPFVRSQRNADLADRSFLALVVKTFGPAGDRNVDLALPNLSALLHAFDFMSAISADWNEMFFTRGEESMSVLLRGAACAAACNEAMLAAEADHALTVFGVDRDPFSSAGLRELGSGSPRELDWEATSSISFSIPHLLNVLRWPQAYARVALLLLYYHTDRTSVRRGIVRSLEGGVPYVVQNAKYLSDVLGSELVDVIAGAVATPIEATAPLLVTLSELEPSSSRTLERVTNALVSINGLLVDAATEAAMNLPRTDHLSSVLRAQLEHWRRWAAGEGPLEKRDYGLVESGTTVYAKRLAEKLVKALAAHGALSYDDLVSLARSGAGSSEALKIVVAAAARDVTLLERTVDEVANGALPAYVTEQLFCIDNVPPATANRLLSYHDHPNASLRRAVVVGYASAHGSREKMRVAFGWCV